MRILSLVLFLALSAHSEQLNPNLKITEIAPNAFVVSFDPKSDLSQANSLLVEMGPHDRLLVDAPYLPKATEELLSWSEKKFGKKKVVAINTHSHFDRTGANSALLAMKIPVYASNNTIELTRQKQSGALARVATVPADHSFDLKTGLKLDLGGKRAEVYYPGHGHTVDNVVVYLPDFEILYGGCFIVAMPKLGFLGHANKQEWLKALAKLDRFKFKFVIPGHEEGGYSPELVAHTMRLVKNWRP